jgi:stage II sporulation protein D
MHRLVTVTLWTLVIVGLVVLVSCVAGRPRPSRLPSANPPITVLLSDPSSGPVVEVGTEAGVLLTDPSGKQYRIAPGAGGGRAVVRVSGGQVELQGMGRAFDHLLLRPTQVGAGLAVGEGRYRGTILVSAGEGHLMVLNRLPLEEYLRGVVPGEMPSTWPAAALEAQAVAARTYALSEARRRHTGTEPAVFDVHDTARSQVYGGMTVERDSTDRAVQRTRSRVLLDAGQLVHAYFHSTCGGSTADASQFFDEPWTVPLSGRPCGHCTSSKYHTWSCELTLQEAGAALAPLATRAGLARPGALEELTGGRRDAAGRLSSFQATYAAGAIELPALEARLALGPGRLRSTACRFERRGSTLHVTGNGWGHGVGLCQVGARELADAGWSASQILAFYYPGSQLVLLPAGTQRP